MYYVLTFALKMLSTTEVFKVQRKLKLKPRK